MARISTWWGKAWVRAVEEAAYDEADLRSARRLVRTGAVAALVVEDGTMVASIVVGEERWTPRIALQTLEDGDLETLREVIDSRVGQGVELRAGHLSARVHDDLEEAGVELLPHGGDFDATCTCDAWVQPCDHALAALVRAGQILDADPLWLLQLRGLDLDRHLDRHVDRARSGDGGVPDPDLEAVVDAATLARDLLDHARNAITGP